MFCRWPRSDGSPPVSPALAVLSLLTSSRFAGEECRAGRRLISRGGYGSSLFGCRLMVVAPCSGGVSPWEPLHPLTPVYPLAPNTCAPPTPASWPPANPTICQQIQSRQTGGGSLCSLGRGEAGGSGAPEERGDTGLRGAPGLGCPTSGPH